MLVGCKKDLRDAAESSTSTLDERKYVSRQRGEHVMAEIGARTYMECSALRNEGVDDIFEAATRQAMLVRHPAGNNTSSGNGSATLGRATNGLAEKSDRRKSAGMYDSPRGANEQSKGCCIIL